MKMVFVIFSFQFSNDLLFTTNNVQRLLSNAYKYHSMRFKILTLFIVFEVSLELSYSHGFCIYAFTLHPSRIHCHPKFYVFEAFLQSTTIVMGCTKSMVTINEMLKTFAKYQLKLQRQQYQRRNIYVNKCKDNGWSAQRDNVNKREAW